MTGARIDDILRCLTTGEADTAWIRFLDDYAPLLRNIVSQYENDETRSSDCLEFVCAKLSDDRFRRLKAFRPDGPARFKTWLTAVVANLCVDWRRSEYGRIRAPAAIKKLPQIEQLIFDCVFRQGMTRQDCLHVLKARFPKITSEQIGDTTARLHRMLTSEQRWRLSHTRVQAGEFNDDLQSIASQESGPETLVQSVQERERLETALSRLAPKQRLCLQLRYQQDLTLAEVARLMGLSSPFEARGKIQSALSALAKAMKF